ncbi:uncharacterized protein LTR77_004452 [Saxophila tyrrhenica]|uniref:Prolyl 4-hydroxylase alpha subunit domain-containing protein n=1 Tax=Saxophila tyrrhenica TaxID=1690608 RepID=A0AAV9PGQ7_9PEZI|nr:hypothetical protein LTR77_004452 [Saxophila tyrrhenica]
MDDASLPAPLPEDFLATPAPNITVDRVDFPKTTLPEYKNSYAVILDNVLSHEECNTLLRAAEATAPDKGWERAMVNVGMGEQKLILDARNCGRIIWDSRDMVAKIWKRIEHLPDVQEIARLENAAHIFGVGPAKRKEVWKFTRPNERMRFLKYVGGEYFRAHCDGVYETPDRKERSYFTMHLYLNDAGVVAEDELEGMSEKQRTEDVQTVLTGGATTFFAHDMRRRIDVQPKTGRILLFQHRGLLHSGEDVVSGVKYTMRTDLMYTLFDETASDPPPRPPPEKVTEGTDGVSEARAYGYLTSRHS